ncbi:hypothetical protein [Curtobacterium sp. Leaf261]|uniref:hypothetical protein n=1 Tax=Curtobacterium sp. Leaf261 TaxID=1736311 RepID=UPI0006FA466C|nr:hypothetical protein [Curtobacterium sp. Leaf261]KQO62973.1 hypothetical protein ASF23_08765 [Curtobacterium sp. Leaf261]
MTKIIRTLSTLAAAAAVTAGLAFAPGVANAAPAAPAAASSSSTQGTVPAFVGLSDGDTLQQKGSTIQIRSKAGNTLMVTSSKWVPGQGSTIATDDVVATGEITTLKVRKLALGSQTLRIQQIEDGVWNSWHTTVDITVVK